MSLPQPHIPLTVDEVGSVSSLQHWTNTRVRVFGEVAEADAERCTAVLRSAGEENSKAASAASVRVDFGLVPHTQEDFLSGRRLQVMGEVKLDEARGPRPVIEATIVRRFDDVDPKFYHHVLKTCWAPECPLNVTRKRKADDNGGTEEEEEAAAALNTDDEDVFHDALSELADDVDMEMERDLILSDEADAASVAIEDGGHDHDSSTDLFDGD